MKANNDKIYKMVQIKGGQRIEKFKTSDIERALNFHKWYVARYQEGLLLEIVEPKTRYNLKNKTKEIFFE